MSGSVFSPNSGTENTRWTGWRSYLLLALLGVAVMTSIWLASSISAHGDVAEWFPALLISVVVLLGFTIIWGVTQMRRELTDHLSVQSALRQASTFQQALEASTAGGLRARDCEGRITYVSPAFCRMTGFSSEEVLGTRFPDVPYWNPAQSERNLETINQAMNGNIPSKGLEVSMQRKNGEPFEALVIESPFIDVSGQHVGWLGAVIDITEQSRAREQSRLQYERLQATSRLVTMGEMASTMAHELNQPLAAISSYVTGCLNQLDSGHADIAELKEVQQKIARQAQRAASIIGRVHSFVRRTEPHFTRNDLNALIRDALTLIETNALKQQVRIVCDFGTDLPPVTVDTQMIEQVLINLMRNGIDAMLDAPPDTRILTISTRMEEHGVSMSVADQGHGISPEIAPHLFDPFFTTKGKGMGMGLNICRTIAELHHGELSFKPNPPNGTIFTLTLSTATLNTDAEQQ
ncbi:MAG: PAS domain S-box protein [Azoarcus sp.]|jgi:two-component system sensor histidine kinase DctS|nr:PAS domain S-box protein [Azoarcus sp.]